VIEYACPRCDARLTFTVTPGTPRRESQDHDAEAFSDPGEGAEIKGPEQCACGRWLRSGDYDQILQAAHDARL
jgi:hypothetical protein